MHHYIPRYTLINPLHPLYTLLTTTCPLCIPMHPYHVLSEPYALCNVPYPVPDGPQSKGGGGTAAPPRRGERLLSLGLAASPTWGFSKIRDLLAVPIVRALIFGYSGPPCMETATWIRGGSKGSGVYSRWFDWQFKKGGFLEIMASPTTSFCFPPRARLPELR